MRGSRYWTALLALVGVALLIAGPAMAHTQVLRAVPGPGAVVDAPVDQVALTFLDPIRPDVRIDVLGPDGSPVTGLRPAEVDPDQRSARVGFAPLRVEGDYVVDAAFTSADGDLQRHRYQFSVVVPAADRHDDRAGLRPAGVAGGAAFGSALVLAVGVALRRRRQNG